MIHHINVMTRSNLNFNINDIFVGATIGRPLQFTGILGGRTQFAPTDYEENFLFSIIKFCCRICININIYSTGIQKSILVFVYII